MTPTLSSASSSAGGHSPEDQYRVVRKRNRVPLSCAPCRHRKLKCNRGHPCENCVKRGDASSCAYAAPGTRKKNQSSQGSSSSDDMQNRIDRLEGLVLSLMSNGAGSAGPNAAAAVLSATTSTGSADYSNDIDDDEMIKEEGPEEEDDDSDVEQVSSSFGLMKVDKNGPTYVGEMHWAAILKDITEVKNYWAEHKKQYEEQMIKVKAATENRGGGGPKLPAFLFGGSRLPDRDDIMSAIPSKQAVDQLVARYFNSYDPAVHIIHSPTFQKQYELYWANPDGTCVAWIGLLFSMMCLAMQSYARSGDEPPEYRGKSTEMAENYRARTAQCLVLADYTRPVTNIIETLILHLQGEYSRIGDSEVGLSVVAGIITRLAMRMGYHRDSKFYSGITPFQGEMRRRVWSFIKQMDLIFSFQLGLPSIVRSSDCDTEFPRNLFDEEFHEDTTELPPSRPVTEPTSISYMITKARLASVVARIVERLTALEPLKYEEIMKLDTELRGERARTPPHLQLIPIEEAIADPATLIIARYNLDLLYQKGLCILHRRFLGRARANPRYSHSRRSCVDASMVMLSHQATLRREERRLRSVAWLVSSIKVHDFLQAALIVCLDLYHSTKEQNRSSGDFYMWGQERETEMVEALQAAANIWKELKDTSMEAFKAYSNITMMLNELWRSKRENAANCNSNSMGAPAQNSQYQPKQNYSGNSHDLRVEDIKPEHSAAMTLGMLSAGGLTPNTAALFTDSPQPNTPGGNTNMDGTQNFMSQDPMSGQDGIGDGILSPFSFPGQPGNTMDTAGSLDWDAWDTYVQGGSLDPNNMLWPTSMDLPVTTLSELPPNIQASSNLQQQQQYNPLLSGGSVFMGVSTPPQNPPM